MAAWYRFAFPALKPPEPFKVTKTTSLAEEMPAESANQASQHASQVVFTEHWSSTGKYFCRGRCFINPRSSPVHTKVQVAAACDQWRQVDEGSEDQPAASSSGASQLPFWLLAKAPEGAWQAAPLTAFADVSFLGSWSPSSSVNVLEPLRVCRNDNSSDTVAGRCSARPMSFL